MPKTAGRIGLQESIVALRQEIMQSIAASQGEELRFVVGEITMEFYVEVERSVGGEGSIKFWVVELGTGVSAKDKVIHKVIIPLKPVRRDGRPVLTGTTEVPE